MRIALAQLDLTVGDLAGNEERIADALDRARAAGAELALFPELAVTGYPPEDLLLKRHFLREARAVVDRLARATEGIVALVGFPDHDADVGNALALLAEGEVRAVYRKVHLPNYSVFDEQRYFAPGAGGGLVRLGGVPTGLTICEDLWEPGPPGSEEALAGATLLVNASASPYHVGKGLERERMLVQRARDYRTSIAFCNHVGGQDELLFDGHSLLIDARGEVVARACQFAEELLVAELDTDGADALRLQDPRQRAARRFARGDVPLLAEVELPAREGDAPPATEPAPVSELLPELEEVYAALRLGLADYVRKNGFERVVLGLSGGIDSALVLLLAVDALGAERVTAVVMPSPHSSEGTQGDARALAAEAGVECLELAIGPVMEAYEAALGEVFAGREPDLAEENLQARIRGNLLMALSNKFGWLVLTTGNKSETSVGYSTLYGDTAGGFAVIKDVPKTLVYALARHRGAPASIIERAPSAELRADQLDEDSLPPYSRLDAILGLYVEQDLDAEHIAAEGFDPEEVALVLGLVDRAEYKRRQAPPGVRISTKAFGRDRRMPITNRYGRS